MGVERGLERVLGDTSEVRVRLEVEEVEARQLEAVSSSREAALTEAEQEISERARRLDEVECSRQAVRAELAEVEEQQTDLEASVEQLKHEQAAGGGLRRNLEHERQLLIVEAEKLRR